MFLIYRGYVTEELLKELEKIDDIAAAAGGGAITFGKEPLEYHVFYSPRGNVVILRYETLKEMGLDTSRLVLGSSYDLQI